MNERILSITLLSLLAIGVVALFFATYEKVDDEIFIPPTGEAARNPLLAAQRLLDGLGYEVTSRDQFAPSLELPPPNGTVMALFSYDFMESDELTLLLQWVSDGGHLITAIRPRYGRLYDPVFTPIGIEAYSRVETDTPEFDENGEPVESDTPPPEDVAWDAAARPDREAWGTVLQDNLISISLGDTEPLWSIHDQHGIFATQIAYNDGRITALADIGSFANRRIDKMDHAFMLTQIVGPATSAGPIWLLLSSDFPSIWRLLTDRIGEVLIGGAVLLLMCLWWAAQRFGPLLAPPSRARKAFIEHIEANGRFLWRHNGDQELLTATQQAFLRDARRRHAPLRRLNEEQVATYLARVCGVSAAQANTALDTRNSRRHGEFLTRIQLIKTMWNRL